MTPKLARALAVLIAVAGCGGGTTADSDAHGGDATFADASAPFAATVEDHDYAALDDPDLLNPERGIYYWSPRSDDPHTLVGEWLYLGDWCDREIVWAGRGDPATSAVLDDYAAALEAHRAAGRKVLFRPRYDTPSSDALNACGVFQAATDELTARHVDAIAAMLADYRDVVAFIEAGYLGRWGEWNWSGYGPENAPILADPVRRRAFLDHVIQSYRAAGLERFVGARRPVFARELRESFPASAPFVALHNDCFMTDASDTGTYSNAESGNPFNFATEADAKAYAEMLTADVPFGGETCPAADPRWASCDNMVGAASEPAALHMSYLHGAWAPDAKATWEAGGCYGEIKRRLGYRFELESVEYPPVIAAGERGRVRVHLRNTGWARMHNARRAYLVLRGDAEAWAVGGALPGYTTLNGDVAGDAVRDWLPGQDVVVDVAFAPPASGSYSVRLLIPDPDRPDVLPYSVTLASTRAGVPLRDAATGENDLGVTIDGR